jgi:hypothetical protein
MVYLLILFLRYNLLQHKFQICSFNQHVWTI